MRISTSINVLFDFGKTSAVETVERLHKAGYRVLDMNFADWIEYESPFCGDNWEAWVAEIAETAKRLGMVFSQSHAPMLSLYDAPEKVERMRALTIRSFYASKMLGIEWMIIHASHNAGAFDAAHMRKMKEDNLAYFRQMLEYARETGVGIAIENLPDYSSRAFAGRTYTATPAELVDLIDTLDDPLIAACWDTGHANLQMLPQRECIRALGKRLKALHIQDSDGKYDQHTLPYIGNICWKDVMLGLRDIGYEGDLTYEAHAFIRLMPRELKDAAMSFSYEVACHLVSIFEKGE